MYCMCMLTCYMLRSPHPISRDSRKVSHACCIMQTSHEVEVQQHRVSSCLQQWQYARCPLVHHGTVQGSVAICVLCRKFNVGPLEKNLHVSDIATQGSSHDGGRAIQRLGVDICTSIYQELSGFLTPTGGGGGRGKKERQTGAEEGKVTREARGEGSPTTQ